MMDTTNNRIGQVLQISKGGKAGQIGDRTPSLWFHKSRGIYLVTALSGKANVGKAISWKLKEIYKSLWEIAP